jgi:hypothetical protein
MTTTLPPGVASFVQRGPVRRSAATLTDAWHPNPVAPSLRGEVSWQIDAQFLGLTIFICRRTAGDGLVQWWRTRPRGCTIVRQRLVMPPHGTYSCVIFQPPALVGVIATRSVLVFPLTAVPAERMVQSRAHSLRVAVITSYHSALSRSSLQTPIPGNTTFKPLQTSNILR